MTYNRTKILAFLKTTEEASKTAISIVTRIHQYNLEPELKKLEEEGLIVSRTNPNKTFIYYKLKRKENETTN